MISAYVLFALLFTATTTLILTNSKTTAEPEKADVLIVLGAGTLYRMQGGGNYEKTSMEANAGVASCRCNARFCCNRNWHYENCEGSN